jgi:SAM-dependent methyltransferase
MQMEKDQLAILASQLSHPFGEKGLEIAQMMNETNIRMTKNAISNLNLTPGDSILELGHGNAGHLEFLLSQCEHIQYTGLEISTLMNQEAQQLNQPFIDSKKAAFNLYDGKIIPFETNKFDKLLTVNTLYFWDNPLELIAELSRVMKPKGIFSLTFAHRSFMEKLPFTAFGFRLYHSNDLLNLIEQSSFSLQTEDLQTEKVMTKSGEYMDREFSTFVLKNTK